MLTVGVLLVVHGGGTDAGQLCAADSRGWPAAGAGPAHRGLAAGTAHDPVGSWTPAWQYPVATASPADLVTAPPTESGGKVFTVRDDGTLVVLDAASGRLAWTSEAPAGARGRALVPVALDGCSAVVATSFPDPSDGEPAGAVRAVDLRSHAERWAVAVGDSISSAPEIARGVAFAGVGLRIPQSLSRRYVVLGWNLADPAAPFREDFRAAVEASVATDGDRLYAAAFDQTVYAFRLEPAARRLRQLWSFTTNGILVAAPILGDDGRLFVAGADHVVYALDRDHDGRLVWQADVGDAVDSTPVLDGSTLVVATLGGRVVALDAGTGAVRWSVNVGAGVGRAGRGGLAAIGDRVVVVDERGTVHLLDLGTGHERATWRAPAPPEGPPAIAAGFVDVTCADGHLYALPI